MQRRRMTLLLSLALALLLPLGVAAQPNITATLEDTPDNDPASPGDNIQYEAVISNTGTAVATDVVYSDQSGSNDTTLQSGFDSTPLSLDDNFAATANVEVDSGTFSVLANDFDLDGGTVCVAAGGACIPDPLTVTSTQGQILGGGEVTIDPDGTFSYNPPPGFTGTDTFTYEILDDEGEAVLDASGIPGATSTVTIQVNGPVIWFVDNTATCPCDGRLTNPFDDLAVTSNSFDVNANDDPGDNIFLADGAYTGGLTLLDNQRLIGEGSSSDLGTITGVSPESGSLSLPTFSGTDPTITSSTDGINLGQGNTIRGLTIGNTGASSFAISGVGVGTLSVSEVTIDNSSNGGGVDITTGNLAITFDSVSSNGGTSGIILSNTTGSFTVTGTGTSDSGGIIQNTSGDGISLSNVTNVSLTNMRVSNSGMHGIDANNLSGTNVITDTTIDNSAVDNIHVVNNLSIPMTLDILGTTDPVSSSDSANLNAGNDGIVINGGDVSDISIEVMGTRFDSSDGDHIQTAVSGNATMDVVIDGNQMNATDPFVLGSGISLSSSANFTGTKTFNIVGNNIQDANAQAINVNLGTTTAGGGTGTYTGSINNNTIGTIGDANSGGTGIDILANGGGTLTVTVDNNAVRQFDSDHGIRILQRDGNGTLNATITNNTVSNPEPGGFNGLSVQAGAATGDNGQVCADIRDNTLTGSGANTFAFDTDFSIRQRKSTTVNLPGYSGNNNNDAAVVLFVQGNNVGTPTGSATNDVGMGGGGFTGTGTTCP